MTESVENWRKRAAQARAMTIEVKGKEPDHNELGMSIIAGFVGFLVSTAALSLGGVPQARSEIIVLGITAFCAVSTYLWQRYRTNDWHRQYAEFLNSIKPE